MNPLYIIDGRAIYGRQEALHYASCCAITAVKGMMHDIDGRGYADTGVALAEQWRGHTQRIEVYGDAFGKGDNPNGCMTGHFCIMFPFQARPEITATCCRGNS